MDNYVSRTDGLVKQQTNKLSRIILLLAQYRTNSSAKERIEVRQAVATSEGVMRVA